jgi:hypothetical protein
MEQTTQCPARKLGRYEEEIAHYNKALTLTRGAHTFYNKLAVAYR